ncbi:hypothetical protein JCM10213_007244 [Rhodosporidiobolus nylandii]
MSQPCAVCDKQTSQRCSGCGDRPGALFFCSREHQKLIWPTHKLACENGGKVAYPPLTSQEAQILLPAARNAVVLSMPPTNAGIAPLEDQFRNMGLYDGDWLSLLSDLQRSPCPIPEPKRAGLLNMLRSHLSSASVNFATGETLQPPFRGRMPLTVWMHVCMTYRRLMNVAYPALPDPLLVDDAEPFLRQMVIAHTLTFAVWEGRTGATAALVYLAFDRATKMADGMGWPAPFAKEMKEYIGRTRALVDQR